MRLLALAFLLCAASVSADDFLSGDELAAEVAKSCAEGCVTFSREEAARFQAGLADLIARKQKEAFEAGKQYQAQSCRSLL